MPRKPMLTVDALIEHAKDKGIRFEKMSEQDAKEYLDKNNNYFKLTSYRKNYPKAVGGSNAGQYIHLDFAYLIELARIDVEIRHILLKMCLDIEHFLKVSLIKAVEDHLQSGDEDGYKIVTDFMVDAGRDDFGIRAENASKRSGSISRRIQQNKKNPYCEGLIAKYCDEMPIWVLVELISFGDLKDLISYYSEATGWPLPVDVQSLDRVRQIRNAAAHSNCMINDLTCPGGATKTPPFITNFVSNASISRPTREKRLSNRRINQIVHLLYVYDKVVCSENTREIRLTELKELIDERMLLHADYFQQNDMLTATYGFFKKIIDYIKTYD